MRERVTHLHPEKIKIPLRDAEDPFCPRVGRQGGVKSIAKPKSFAVALDNHGVRYSGLVANICPVKPAGIVALADDNKIRVETLHFRIASQSVPRDLIPETSGSGAPKRAADLKFDTLVLHGRHLF
jgi:hypothetical protein